MAHTQTMEWSRVNGPITVDWTLVDDLESTLADDMAELATLDTRLPAYVISEAMARLVRKPSADADALASMITRVARELVRRGIA